MRTTPVLLCILIALAGSTLAACTMQEIEIPPVHKPSRTLSPSPAPIDTLPETSGAPLQFVPEVVAEIPVDDLAEGFAFSEETGELYAATDDAVAVIEVATHRLVDTIHVAGGPGTIRVDPAAGLLYVAENAHGTPGVTVIDVGSHTVVDRVQFVGMTKWDGWRLTPQGVGCG